MIKKKLYWILSCALFFISTQTWAASSIRTFTSHTVLSYESNLVDASNATETTVVNNTITIDDPLACNASGSAAIATTARLGSLTGNGNSSCRGSAGHMVSSFSIDDIYFTRLAGYANLSSSFSTAAHVTAYADVYNGSNGNNNFSVGIQSGAGYDGFNTAAETLGFGSSQVLETSFFTARIGTAQRLAVTANLDFVVEGTSGREQTIYNGNGLFNVRLGGSPVFVLPEGYTANSVSGSIVDNYYVGFDPFAPNTPPSSVPEASSLYLLAFGLLGLFAGARRKA